MAESIGQVGASVLEGRVPQIVKECVTQECVVSGLRSRPYPGVFMRSFRSVFALFLAALALTSSTACSSSSGSPPASAQGPNCTALQICCNALPTGDGGASDDPQADCEDTANEWSSVAAATAEADCSAAEKQYEKEGLCGKGG
jgi:hypothetical protein